MKGSPLAEWLLSERINERGGPMNRKLFEAIRSAILDGTLPAGHKLSPTRELACELGLSRNTVLYAYERLEDEGYTVSHVGSGTFVSDTVPDPAMLKNVRASRSRVSTVVTAARVSRRAEAVMAGAGASELQLGAFVPGIPDVTQFPHAIWGRLLSRAWRRPNQHLMGYGSSMGYVPLKRALAKYLRLARGVNCEDEQIVITHGAHQAMDLCARLLADPGDEAWIEDPGYWGARSVFTAAGLKLRPVPVDENGMTVPKVTDEHRPRIIFVTPSHQYPSGVVMSLSRRRTLIELAHRLGAWIVEDDYDSEFRYRHLPLPCLQGLDARQRTIYVGSFSKALYPGLRLGFLVSPPALAEAFAKMHSELYRGGLLMLQHALADFIDEGHYAAHIRRMRRIYGERQALLSAELRRLIGDQARILGSEAGLHLTLALDRVDDLAVERAAIEEGIVARPLSPYYARRHRAPSGLVLGYGGVPDDCIETSVRKLAKAFGRVQS